jgi:hypothetical protein
MAEAVTLAALFEEVREARFQMSTVLMRLNALAKEQERQAAPALSLDALPKDARAAAVARAAARARGFFWAAEFALTIGKSYHFVTDRCKARAIPTMGTTGRRLSKPFRIPLRAVEEWTAAREF